MCKLRKRERGQAHSWYSDLAEKGGPVPKRTKAKVLTSKREGRNGELEKAI